MRGPVRVPNHRGQGRRPGSCLVSAGQEVFDSFARPFERRFRRCETAVKPGDRQGRFDQCQRCGAAPATVPCGAVSFAGPESEGMRPKTAATGRRKAHFINSEASFGAPTSLKSPGRKAAEGFGVGPSFSPSGRRWSHSDRMRGWSGSYAQTPHPAHSGHPLPHGERGE